VKYFRNKDGFSLAELLIAAGLMGALSLAFAGLMKSQTSSQMKVASDSEITTLVSVITQSLLNDKSCTNTFKSISNIKTATSLSGIYNRVDEEILKSGVKYENGVYINSFALENLTLTPDPIPVGQSGFGEIDVVINFEKKSKMVLGAKTMQKKVRVSLEVDDSYKPVKCYAATENAINSSKDQMCASLGGTFDFTLQECLLADYPQLLSKSSSVSNQYLDDFLRSAEGFVSKLGDTMTGILSSNSDIITTSDVSAKNLRSTDQVCVQGNCRDFVAKNCSPGQFVEKINSDGTLVCKGISCSTNKYFEGFDVAGNPICKALPNEKCSTNQYIKEIKSDGSVVCENVPYNWGVACSSGQYIQSISSGGVPMCVATSTVTNTTCPANHYVSSIVNNTPVCTKIPERNITYRTVFEGGSSVSGLGLSCRVRCPSGYFLVSGGCTSTANLSMSINMPVVENVNDQFWACNTASGANLGTGALSCKALCRKINDEVFTKENTMYL